MILNPFIWIGLIIVFSPKFVETVKEYLRNRRRRNEISDNRLNERLINDAIANSENIVFEGNRS